MLSSRLQRSGAKKYQLPRARSPSNSMRGHVDDFPDKESLQVLLIKSDGRLLHEAFDNLDKKDCGAEENAKLYDIIRAFRAADDIVTLYEISNNTGWNTVQARKVYEGLVQGMQLAKKLEAERAKCPPKKTGKQLQKEKVKQLKKYQSERRRSDRGVPILLSIKSLEEGPLKIPDIHRINTSARSAPVSRQGSLTRIIAAMRRSSPFT